MSKLKTVYDNLLPDVKTKLQVSARQYSTAKRLKYVLMSKFLWSDLTINEMRDLLTYTDTDSFRLDWNSFMYGDKLIK